jgi:hypothetical protein
MAALLLLGACGGPTADGTGARATDDTAGGDGCPGAETRLGDGCWSASGTHWRVEADGPGGAYRFELDLLAAGRVRSTDHDAASPASDEWYQDGPLLRIFLSDRFVEYRARVTNGTVLVGEAVNVRGQRWSWVANRVFAETPCSPNETRLEAGCMTVAGTRWELAAEGSEGHLLEFLDDGRLSVGPGDPEGHWEQEGASLRFSLTEGGPTFVARVEDERELRSAEDAERRFTATRVDTIPPVIHR